MDADQKECCYIFQQLNCDGNALTGSVCVCVCVLSSVEPHFPYWLMCMLYDGCVSCIQHIKDGAHLDGSINFHQWKLFLWRCETYAPRLYATHFLWQQRWLSMRAHDFCYSSSSVFCYYDYYYDYCRVTIFFFFYLWTHKGKLHIAHTDLWVFIRV